MTPIDKIIVRRNPRTGAWEAKGGDLSAKGDSSVEAHLALLEKAAK